MLQTPNIEGRLDTSYNKNQVWNEMCADFHCEMLADLQRKLLADFQSKMLADFQSDLGCHFTIEMQKALANNQQRTITK